MKRIMGTVSLIALSALPAVAQDAFDLDTITIYANQTPTALSRSGATVEVVTADDLAVSPRTKLADYLDTIPGVVVSSNGGLGGVTTVRVRGLSGAYVPVLINGIDVTDPSSTQTQFDWTQLNMGGISRVELVKGSQSAVHGSEAVGGVINITTNDKTAQGTEGDAMIEVGSYGTRRAAVTLRSGNERGGVSFGLASVKTDGFSARAGTTEKDGYDGKQLTFGAEYDLTDTLTVGFDAYAVDAEYEYDPSTFDENGKSTSNTRAARIYADLQTGAVDHNFSVSRYTIDRMLTEGGFSDPYKGTRNRVDYKATWSPSDSYRLTFGADWTKETFLSTGGIYAPPTWARSGSTTSTGDVTVKGIFTEAAFAPTDALDVTVSLRRDDHSDFGAHTTGRVAVAYRLSDATTLRALASNGFRAPSLYELYDSQYGNATLKPETSRNLEFGIEHAYANGANVSATAFYTEIDNPIQWSGGAYNQVAGTTKTKGLELAATYALSPIVTANWGYTFTDSRDSGGNPQLRIPRHDLTLGLTANLTDALDVGVSVQRVLDRPTEFGTPLKDYTLVNATASYAINDGMDAYLRVENLTDSDYQTAAGYNTAGRSAYFGIRASF